MRLFASTSSLRDCTTILLDTMFLKRFQIARPGSVPLAARLKGLHVAGTDLKPCDGFRPVTPMKSWIVHLLAATKMMTGVKRTTEYLRTAISQGL